MKTKAIIFCILFCLSYSLFAGVNLDAVKRKVKGEELVMQFTRIEAPMNKVRDNYKAFIEREYGFIASGKENLIVSSAKKCKALDMKHLELIVLLEPKNGATKVGFHMKTKAIDAKGISSYVAQIQKIADDFVYQFYANRHKKDMEELEVVMKEASEEMARINKLSNKLKRNYSRQYVYLDLPTDSDLKINKQMLVYRDEFREYRKEYDKAYEIYDQYVAAIENNMGGTAVAINIESDNDL